MQLDLGHSYKWTPNNLFPKKTFPCAQLASSHSPDLVVNQSASVKLDSLFVFLSSAEFQSLQRFQIVSINGSFFEKS